MASYHIPFLTSNGDSFITSDSRNYEVIGEIFGDIGSFDVHFYRSEVDPKTVFKDTANGSLRYHTIMRGTLREGTSMVNPTIVVQSGSTFTWNYAYIGEFLRYYFITDIRAISFTMYEITMRCDVLRTYMDGILSQTTRVLRSYSHRNPKYTDTLIPTDGETELIVCQPAYTLQDMIPMKGHWQVPWISPLSPYSESGSINGAGYIQVKLACSKVNDMYLPTLMGYVYLTMPIGGLWNLMQNLRMMGFGEGDYGIEKTILDVCWCPTGWIGQDDAQRVTSISYVNWVGISTMMPNVSLLQAYYTSSPSTRLGNQVETRWKIDIPNRGLDSVEYRNRSPYKTMELTLNPFGKIPLDCEKYGNLNKICVQVETDPSTGVANLYVFEYTTQSFPSYRELLGTANVNVPIDIYALENNFRQGLATVVSALSLTASQNYFSGLERFVEGVTQPPHIASVSGSGSANALMDYQPRLYISKKHQADPNRDTQGYLYNGDLKLSQCEGYCKVDSGVHLDSAGFGFATKAEIEEIESLLTSGVVFPKFS